MDESGCLGFDFSKSKPTKYFIITFIFTNSNRPLEKIVKSTFQFMPAKHRKSHSGVLHFHKEQPRIRLKLLNELKRKDNISIMAIILNKSKVHTRLQDEKSILYNFVTNILLDRILTKKLVPTNEPVYLVASRRETNKFLNENFEQYISNTINHNHKVLIHPIIKTPHQEKALQVVDAASWSIFRKYEHQDESYYNIIKDLIIEENPLFP